MKLSHLIFGFAMAASSSAFSEVNDIGAFNNGVVKLYYTANGEAYRAECALSGSIPTGSDLRQTCNVHHSLRSMPEADFYNALTAKYLEKVARTELTFEETVALDSIKYRLPGQGIEQRPYMFPVDLSQPSTDQPSKFIQNFVSLFDAAFGLNDEGLLLGRYITEIQRGDFYLTLTMQGLLNITKLSTQLSAFDATTACTSRVIEILYSSNPRPQSNEVYRLTTVNGRVWSLAANVAPIKKGYLWLRLRNEQTLSKCMVTLHDYTNVVISQVQGQNPGQVQGQNPGQGQVQGQNPGQVQGQNPGQGQVQGQNPGQGQGQGQNPGQGQGQGQVQGQNPGQGQGQGQNPGQGQGQGQGQVQGQNPDQVQGQNPDQGQGQGQGQNPDQGQGQNPDPGQA